MPTFFTLSSRKSSATSMDQWERIRPRRRRPSTTDTYQEQRHCRSTTAAAYCRVLLLGFLICDAAPIDAKITLSRRALSSSSRFGSVFGGGDNASAETDIDNKSSSRSIGQLFGVEATVPSASPRQAGNLVDEPPTGPVLARRGTRLKHRSRSAKMSKKSKRKVSPCAKIYPPGRLRDVCEDRKSKDFGSSAKSSSKSSSKESPHVKKAKRKDIVNYAPNSMLPSRMPSLQPFIQTPPEQAPTDTINGTVFPTPFPTMELMESNPTRSPISRPSEAPSDGGNVDRSVGGSTSQPTNGPGSSRTSRPTTSIGESPTVGSPQGGESSSNEPASLTPSPPNASPSPNLGVPVEPTPAGVSGPSPTPTAEGGSPPQPSDMRDPTPTTETSRPTVDMSRVTSQPSPDLDGAFPSPPTGVGSPTRSPSGGGPSPSLPTVVDTPTSTIATSSPSIGGTSPTVNPPTPGPNGSRPSLPTTTETSSPAVVGSPTPLNQPTVGTQPTSPTEEPSTPTGPSPESTMSPVVGPSPTDTPSPVASATSMSINPAMDIITDIPSAIPMNNPSTTAPQSFAPTSFPVDTPSPDAPGALPPSLIPVAGPTTATQIPTLSSSPPSISSSMLVTLPTTSPSSLGDSNRVSSSPFSIEYVLPSGTIFDLENSGDFINAQVRVVEFLESYFETFFENRNEATLVDFEGEILESDPTIPSVTLSLVLTFDPSSDVIPTSDEIDVFTEIATFEAPFLQDALDDLGDLGPDNIFSQTTDLNFQLRPELIAQSLRVSLPVRELTTIPLTPFRLEFDMSGNPTEEQKNTTAMATIDILDGFFYEWFSRVYPESYSRLKGDRNRRYEVHSSQLAFELAVEGAKRSMRFVNQRELDQLVAIAFDPPAVDPFLRFLGSLPDDNPYASTSSLELKLLVPHGTRGQWRQRTAAILVALLSLLTFAFVALLGNRLWPHRRVAKHGNPDKSADQGLLDDRGTSHYSFESTDREHYPWRSSRFWDESSSDEEVITFSLEASDPLLFRPISSRR